MEFTARTVHKELYKPIHAGAAIDIANLYERYKQLNTCSFDQFSALYAEKEFTSIYLGHCTAEELIEFSERVLQIAVSYIFPPDFDDVLKPYVVAPCDVTEQRKENSYVAQVFGIYLTYSLYSLQPNKFVCLIHVTPNQYKYLSSAVVAFADKGDLDASFCLFRLFDANAFQVFAFHRDYEMLSRQTHAYRDEAPMPKNIKRKPLIHIEALKNDSTLQQLQRIHEQYRKMKAQMGIPSIGRQGGNLGPAEELQRIDTQARLICNELEQKSSSRQSIYNTRRATRDRAARGGGNRQQSEHREESGRKRRQTIADDPAIQHLYDAEGSLRNTARLLETIESQIAGTSEAGTSRSKTAPVKVKPGKKPARNEAAQELLLSPRKRVLSEVHQEPGEVVAPEDASLANAMNEEAEMLEAEADRILEELTKP